MRRLAVVLLLTLVSACSGPQAPPPEPDLSTEVVDAALTCQTETGGAAHTLGQLSNGTEIFLLDGGVTALLKRTPGNPVVAVRLYFDGGSRLEDPAQNGVTSFALDAASSGGTTLLTKTEMAAQLASMGSAIGFRVENDFSTLSMSSLDVYFDDTWALFRQVVDAPIFPDAEVERIRERHLHAIRARREDPDTRVVDAARSLMFAGHPYANDPAGTEEAVAALTRTDLAAAYYGLYDSSRMLLVVVGDIDRAHLEGVVADTFNGTPSSGTRPPRPEPLTADQVEVAIDPVTLPTNYILGMAPAPAPSDPDYPALRLALAHLSDRLFEEVRSNRNLSYAVSAGVSTRMANYTYLYVTTVDPAAALPVMADEVAALKTQPLTPTDVEQLIAGFTTSYYQGIDSNGALANELAWWVLYGGGAQKVDEFVQHIHEVTPADIQRVANEYLGNYQFGFVGDPGAIDPSVVSSLFSADGT